MKFKLAHRRHLIKILKQVSEELEREDTVNVAKAARAKAVGRTPVRTVKHATSKRPVNGKHSRAA